MSDNKSDLGSLGKQFQRHLRRSKTISVSNFIDNDRKPSAEGPLNDETPEKRSPSPVRQPTSSCQALKHAVSALTRIDDFVLEVLGDGFFANVYKATHRVTSEEMVMKINKDTANRASALREVQLMNKLSHPNILRFLGVCVHEGQLHALTEYISGGTLEELLASKQEELPWFLRIRLSLDIAKGMRYLHLEGVFHRDLTSKNILIKKGDNRNYQAIIADFGLATKIPDPKAAEPLPPVGCPWWMAPEVINAKFYDERADIFSYGIILLEMTARIEADPETMPRTKNFGVDYVKFCEMVDYCPLDFLQLAFKCCQIQPDQRPNCSVIISTIQKIYKNLHTNSLSYSGRLHKRSKSEDNIVQNSDGYTGIPGEEVFMTPQIMAQAMTKDDPHYCPANANPFANISRFKDGRKVHELPRQWKSNGSNSGLACSGKSIDLLTSSQNSIIWNEKQESQSLPSSPIMLRKAAEKMHQASLHGSDAVQTESRHELRFSASSDSQEMLDGATASDKRALFSGNRTRSLGSLDFWNSVNGSRNSSKSKSGKNAQIPNHSESVGYCNRFAVGIRESSVEDKLETGDNSDGEFMDNDESCHSEYDSNVNYSVASNTYHSFINDGTSNAVPWGSCDESLSTCSMSSFVSCGDITEAEASLEVTSDSSIPCQVENERKHAFTDRKNQDVGKPQIAVESGSYDCNHFSIESKKLNKRKNCNGDMS
ncbi:hypothetical protein BsWGS_02393 [Bradybaena similaris]